MDASDSSETSQRQWSETAISSAASFERGGGSVVFPAVALGARGRRPG